MCIRDRTATATATTTTTVSDCGSASLCELLNLRTFGHLQLRRVAVVMLLPDRIRILLIST
eukprot:6465055-Alexandrium_andersonii.AAC.1